MFKTVFFDEKTKAQKGLYGAHPELLALLRHPPRDTPLPPPSHTCHALARTLELAFPWKDPPPPPLPSHLKLSKAYPHLHNSQAF